MKGNCGRNVSTTASLSPFRVGGWGVGLLFRNLRRGGIYSIINIGGLAIGMAAAMLIMLWVYHQWSYDRFHEKSKQLYCLWSHNEKSGSWTWTPRIVGPTLVENYADIVNMTRFNMWPQIATCGEKKINLETALVDPGFLDMFSFPLLQGDVHTALNDPHSIILTQDAAHRLFGDENPLGKSIIMQTKYPVTVTGVMADLPANTQFEFAAVRPYLSLKETGGYDEKWGNYSTVTYVELRPGADAGEMDLAIGDIIGQHTGGNDPTRIFLYPLANWHLYSIAENGKVSGGLIETVRTFSFIALLILLIACINFMNLATARSIARSREIGVRKVIGARRSTLIKQYLGESLLTAVVASLFAIIMVGLCLPPFSRVMGERLVPDLSQPGLWVAWVLFVLLTGLLAGSYPAFYLSSFRPVAVLKGVAKSSGSLITPRKVLIVVQFFLAVVLITSTLVIHRQVRYAQDRNTGYNKDQLIYMELTPQMERNRELIRKELLDSRAALSITRTTSPMTAMRCRSGDVDWQGKNPGERIVFNLSYVDADWAETTGVILLQGRDIDPIAFPTDSSAALLNETAVKAMGFEHPLGQIVKEGGKDWHIVGVVKDFVVESPYKPVEPMMIGGPAGWHTVMHIKLNGANRMADNLAKAGQVFKTYNPDFPFEYTFVDEDYAAKFAEEQRMESLISWFAGLAVFISCLGLFGLSAYMAENRRKEIGVSKVLGASVGDIASLLSREFLVLVLVSLVFAIPVAWYVMTVWLEGYAYRANIPWWLFVVVAAIILAVTLLTVSFQAVKAATANPVKAIKSE